MKFSKCRAFLKSLGVNTQISADALRQFGRRRSASIPSVSLRKQTLRTRLVSTVNLAKARLVEVKEQRWHIAIGC